MLENAGEVALVGEAGQLGDLGQRRVRAGQVTAGQGDALAAQVSTDGTAEVAVEGAGQVARVDPRRGSEVGQRESDGAALGQQVADFPPVRLGDAALLDGFSV
jgi:hypothetical protein